MRLGFINVNTHQAFWDCRRIDCVNMCYVSKHLVMVWFVYRPTHCCFTIIKLGGYLSLAKLAVVKVQGWSWLYIVMGYATPESNVLTDHNWLQQSEASCAEWH